jgi:hypothetical protein
MEHRVLCHHNCGNHIESLLYPSSGQRDLISASEAIWLHNIVEQSAMYSASTVLRETLDCFLLNHELIADLKQKHLPDVLFLSEILPAQSASV